VTGYLEPDAGDRTLAAPGSTSPGGIIPAYEMAGDAAIDMEFKAAVIFALDRKGIDIHKIDVSQLDSLVNKLWADTRVQDAYQEQLAGGADPQNPTLNVVAKVAATIDQELFDPTQSTRADLITMGAQMRQASGLPLTSAERNAMLGDTSAVPAPFDQSAVTGYGYDFGDPTSYGTHQGVDYDVPMNTPIYASFEGTVEVQPNAGGYGNKLVLHLANGYSMVFGHLNDYRVVNGQQVSPGDLLALSDSTGDSTGPHIHLEWRSPSGEALNPKEMIQHIWSGTTYSALGLTGMGGQGISAAAARDRLLGEDPILQAKYPEVTSVWSKYFGNKPTGAQILSIVGGGVGAGTTGGQGGAGTQLADLLRQAGFPENVIPTMVAIGLAESGGRADAVGDRAIGGSIGIWQIYSKAHPNLVQKYNLTDPLQNAMAAKEVFDSQGLGAWSTYNNGNYRQFLGQNGLVSGGGANLDVGQIEDRIRGMASHIPGMAVGQYSDLRSALNAQSQAMFGHDVTDGMIKEANDKGYTGKAGMQFYLEQMSIAGKIPANAYSSIASAAAPHMNGLWNEKGFDPRIAHAVYQAQQPQAEGPGGPYIEPDRNPDPVPQQPPHYLEPDRND
jgi:murein DD-endopeptidase MepM/ murein hydrolase activator NlpD